MQMYENIGHGQAWLCSLERPSFVWLGDNVTVVMMEQQAPSTKGPKWMNK